MPRVALALLLIAVALLAAIAIHQWVVEGTRDPILAVRLGLVLLGLLVLARATLGPSASRAPEAPRCERCGGATFETRRSMDRATVVTCFACGFEAQTSDSSPGGKPPRTPRPGEPGRAP